MKSVIMKYRRAIHEQIDAMPCFTAFTVILRAFPTKLADLSEIMNYLSIVGL